ncbi:MAG: HAMP domain-containing protein [Sphingomonas sp.]|uniref:sensor histidine kinase n=1 Tax=Sphingomonas sp. TaxID=28214 RepID=UPI001AC03A30|nr:CHASE4 domain-containing protein [Sphingomonas sp.]MBN8808295.1 HAMP domain-containing protein [Sphingomonas sp.]
MPIRQAIARGRQKATAASLGGKLLLVLAAVGLIGSVALTLLLAAVITPSFNALEHQSIDGHVERTRAALNDFAVKVENSVRDYGDWNSSYDYIVHPTKAFEAESFSPLAMANLDMDGMAYLRPDRSLVIARWIDPRTGRERDNLRDAMVAKLRALPLDAAMKGGSSGHFYTRLGDVVAAVGVAQVRRSDGSGTPHGYVLMVRQLTPRQLSGLLQVRARLDLGGASAALVTTNADTLQIAVPITGPDGRAVAAARFAVPRDVSLLGRHMLWLAVAGATLLLLIVLAVLRRMITRLVLRPLGRVEAHMQQVSASGSLALLDRDDAARDEIASLGRSFNAMLVQLKDLREQIEVQGFELGRSESAVAVMHNVRNALNPITTILSQGIDQPAPVDRAMLDRAIAELGGETEPDRRVRLSRFVAAAVAAEDRQRADRRDQMQVGRDAMRQVLEIIGTQQVLAHERPPLEPCDATQIIAQNATIALHAGDGRSIAFAFPARPHPVMANRVLLSQVIGNLFANAADAIGAVGGSGSIKVTVDDLPDGRVEIAIRDSGEGFDASRAAQLFQRGYSTRADKSGGLGLHWCANSMIAMQGSLNLASEGPGLGAIAKLVLCAPEPAATGLAA